MIMFLGHILKEHMQIPAKNGSWLVLALNIFTCEWFCFCDLEITDFTRLLCLLMFLWNIGLLDFCNQSADIIFYIIN